MAETEAPVFSLDAAYEQINVHLEAIGILRAAIDGCITEQNQRASQVINIGTAALTSAESRVARLLASPMTASEMAEQLHVSANTVKTHLKSIYRKLDVARRREAVEALRANGAAA